MKKNEVDGYIEEENMELQEDQATSENISEEMEKDVENGKVVEEGDNDVKSKKRGFGFYTFLAGVFIVLGMLISFVSAVAIQKTSGVQFCGACHSMTPMVNAYKNSVHGGFGDSGVVAKCADCHLPHDTLFGYIVQKGKSGMWDLWVETMRDTSKIDWFERREEKRNYVYDSGCLHCHQNLLKATKLNSQPFVAHKAYFENKLKVKEGNEWKKGQCVDCHKYVGHYQLENHLPVLEEETSEDQEKREGVRYE